MRKGDGRDQWVVRRVFRRARLTSPKKLLWLIFGDFKLDFEYFLRIGLS